MQPFGMLTHRRRSVICVTAFQEPLIRSSNYVDPASAEVEVGRLPTCLLDLHINDILNYEMRFFGIKDANALPLQPLHQTDRCIVSRLG